MEDHIQIKKPALLKIASIVALTYHIVFFIIFVSGIIFNQFITTALANYFPDDIGTNEVLYFSMFGAFFYVVSVVGIIYLRRLKKIGLIIYTISIISFFIIKFVFWDISYINLVVNLLFITIFTSFYKHYN